jgi:hypothetical protein
MGFPDKLNIRWKLLDEPGAHHIYAVIAIPSDGKSSNLFDLCETDDKEGECEVSV